MSTCLQDGGTTVYDATTFFIQRGNSTEFPRCIKILREDAHDAQVEDVALRLRVSARVCSENSLFQ